MSYQRTDFQDRVARMSAEHQAARPSKKIKQDYKANTGYALSFVWAFLTGILSVFLVRLVIHHMMGGAAIEDLSFGELLMNAVFAGVIILAIRMATKLNGKEHLMCQTTGLLVAFTGFHNLSHWAPAPMSLVFSQEFVAETQGRTYANTLIYRGIVFYFGPKPGQSLFGEGARDDRRGTSGTDFTPRGGNAFVSRL